MIHGSFHDDQVLVGPAGVIVLDLDSVALGDPLLDVGHFASYLSAAGEHAARTRFLDACSAGPEALLFEAVALVRWSSLPFRALEPHSAGRHGAALGACRSMSDRLPAARGRGG